MPKPKYDHPVIQKGAVQVFAHLAQKPMSADLKKVKMIDSSLNRRSLRPVPIIFGNRSNEHWVRSSDVTMIRNRRRLRCQVDHNK